MSHAPRLVSGAMQAATFLSALLAAVLLLALLPASPASAHVIYRPASTGTPAAYTVEGWETKAGACWDAARLLLTDGEPRQHLQHPQTTAEGTASGNGYHRPFASGLSFGTGHLILGLFDGTAAAGVPGLCPTVHPEGGGAVDDLTPEGACAAGQTVWDDISAGFCPLTAPNEFATAFQAFLESTAVEAAGCDPRVSGDCELPDDHEATVAALTLAVCRVPAVESEDRTSPSLDCPRKPVTTTVVDGINGSPVANMTGTLKKPFVEPTLERPHTCTSGETGGCLFDKVVPDDDYALTITAGQGYTGLETPNTDIDVPVEGTGVDVGTVELERVTRAVTASVKDSTGANVAGATVNASDGPDEDSSCVSAADGTCTLNLMWGTWTLGVTPPAGSSFRPSADQQLVIPATDPVLSPEFVLAAAGGDITLALTDAIGGAVVTGATVSFGNGTASGDCPETATAGTYTCAVPVGNAYTLQTAHPHYQDATVSAGNVADGQTVNAAKALDRSVALATISVASDEEGTPAIDGATVTVTGSDSGNDTTEVCTSGETGPGECDVVVPWGSYAASASKAATETAPAYSSGGSTPFTINPGDTTAAAAVQVSPLEASGTVDVPVRDEIGNAALSGAAVDISGGDVQINCPEIIGSAGQYRCQQVPVGSAYSVTVQKSGYDDGAVQDIAVAEDETTTLDAVTLARVRQALPVRVVLDDAEATPVAGAQASATMSGGPSGSCGAQTGADGRCTIASLPWGTYSVTASKDGLTPSPVSVTIPADGSADEAVVVMSDTPAFGSITGTVRNTAGATVPDATVTVAKGAFTRSATSGAGGSYALAEVPADSGYTLTATKTGYSTHTIENVTLPAGATLTRDFTIDPTNSGGGSGGGGGGRGRGSRPDPLPTPTATGRPSPDPTSAPGPAPEQAPAERVSGTDRASTAVAVSQGSFSPGVPAVFLATASGYADALAGGPAAARLGGPILLVERDRVPDATRAELQRLRPDQIRILGGTSAVSDAVATAVADLAPAVVRSAGNDRFATAATVSQSTFPAGARVAYVATGGQFADALSGGAAAAHADGPVLLTTPETAPDATIAELDRLGVTSVILLGGTSAIAETVRVQILAATGATVDRVSGPDRYATSAAISAQAFPDAVDTVYVATGDNYPDALAGVPAAAQASAPLLLVRREGIPTAVADELERLRPSRIVILGGEGAVSHHTARALGAYTSTSRR